MNWFMKLGIQKKVQAVLLGIFLLCAVICIGVSVGISVNLEKENIRETVTKTAEEEELLLKNFFADVDEISINLMYSSWLQEPIINGKIRNPSVVTEIQDNMSSLSFLYSDIRFVVMTLEGQTVSDSRVTDFDYAFKIEEQPWYEEFLEQKKYLTFEEEQPFKEIEENRSVTLFYAFHNYYTLDPLGYLIVRVPMENIENVLGQYDTQECHTELLIGKTEPQALENSSYKQTSAEDAEDTGHKIRFGAESMPDETYLEEVRISEADGHPIFLENSSLCVSSRELELYGKEMTLYSVFDRSDSGFVSQNPMIWLALLAILLLIGLALLAVSFAISRYLTAPIIECRDAMQEIQNNNLGVTLENRYRDEIGNLIDGFNRMSMSIGDLVETNKRISVLQKDAEFKILERQLNPHFLFNSLELINSMIFTENYEAAGHIAASLGPLYRYNLRSDKWITFREELEYTRNYLEVMSYKMEALEMDFDVEESVLDALIIKATLQPLVENSIRHGFKGRVQENCLSLMVDRTKKGIWICVMDNGCGMSAETCGQLTAELDEIRRNPGRKLPDSSHVGVKNVFQRLYLEYGEDFEFQVISREYAGTRIEITVPERRNDV